LLHLLEDELDHQTEERKTTSKLGSDMQVHVTACILSVCGWACRLVLSGDMNNDIFSVTHSIWKLHDVSYEKRNKEKIKGWE
jgi:hypothetical protein